MSKINFAPLVQTEMRLEWIFRSLSLLLLFLLVAGCGQNSAAPPGAVYRKETAVLPTGAPKPKPTPVSTRVVPATVFTPGPTPTITPIPAEARGFVVEVADGDTIGVVLEGDPPTKTYQVRYLGIDAPPNAASVPWGVVAFEVNRRLTSGKVVRLVRDQTDADADGRLLRYVYLGEEMLSVTLTAQGLARASIQEPDTRFQNEILEAENQAKTNKQGLWGPPPTATPTVSLTQMAVITPTTGITTPATAEPAVTGTVEPEATEEETPTRSLSPAPSGTEATATRSTPETPEATEPPAMAPTSEPTVESTPGGSD